VVASGPHHRQHRDDYYALKDALVVSVGAGANSVGHDHLRCGRSAAFAVARRLPLLIGMRTRSRRGSRRLRTWRRLRWAALAAGAPALWACSAAPLQPLRTCPTATLQTTLTQKVNNELDLLFMIDDSPSMASMQE
jgi:hypothetical protein